MKKGVLIIAHGSREPSTEQTLQAVVDITREQLSDIRIHICYMEFGSPDIPTALDNMREDGIQDIVAVPYFLFHGVHIQEDIPQAINTYLQAHPDVTVRLGNPLGVDYRIADLLTDRILEQLDL